MIEVKVEGNFADLAGLLPDELLEVTPNIWDAPMLYFMQEMEEKVKTIRSHKVSEETRRWRKWAAMTDYRAPTFVGQTARVIAGNDAGWRTGTLLGQLEGSSEPTVVRNIFHTPQAGRMEYSIDPSAYHDEYPAKFHWWIENVKKVEGGIGFSGEQQAVAIGLVAKGVDMHLEKVWGRGLKRLLFPRIKRSKAWK